VREIKRRDEQARKDGACGELFEKAAPAELGISIRLGRGDPLQQSPATDEQPKQCAQHRIDHEPRLVSQRGDQKRTLQGAEHQIVPQGAHVVVHRNARTSRKQARDRRQEGRRRDRQENEPRPDLRRGWGLKPSDQ
jgi:hypothetical protein